jgi:hypothetical protein
MSEKVVMETVSDGDCENVKIVVQGCQTIDGHGNTVTTCTQVKKAIKNPKKKSKRQASTGSRTQDLALTKRML